MDAESDIAKRLGSAIQRLNAPDAVVDGEPSGLAAEGSIEGTPALTGEGLHALGDAVPPPLSDAERIHAIELLLTAIESRLLVVRTGVARLERALSRSEAAAIDNAETGAGSASAPVSLPSVGSRIAAMRRRMGAEADPTE
jgi:hypothetical protein